MTFTACSNLPLENEVDLTFVGGEVSLALGIVDEFEALGLRIIGPNKAAAQLEASKSFAKDFMARHGVPTARFVTAHTPDFAILELESGGFGDADTPVVVKADGLAAGKGVVVAANRAEAIDAINEMKTLVGAEAADKIVLEECLVGREVSLLMFVDGEDFALMPPTRDHKRIGDGDTGPNTGGMGTITDASLLTDDELQVIVETIIRPTLQGCIREGFPFRGILFLGVMMVEAVSGQQTAVSSKKNQELPTAAANRQLQPMLLEYNVRFGDPETQAILVRLETDLVDICEAMLCCESPGASKGETMNVDEIGPTVNPRLADLDISWKQGSSACIVLASDGYPAKARTGDRIFGIADAKSVLGVEVFHAGTAADAASQGLNFLTAGGRVLGVTATGPDLAKALATAYEAAGMIYFEGMQYRRDIGK